MNNFSQYERWVSIRQISECDSCLKHTRGLSSEYKEEHHCPFWDDSSSYAYEKAPYDDDHVSTCAIHLRYQTFAVQATNKDDAYEAYHHRRLMAAGGEPTCGDGEEPLVSTAVLHEVKNETCRSSAVKDCLGTSRNLPIDGHSHRECCDHGAVCEYESESLAQMETR